MITEMEQSKELIIRFTEEQVGQLDLRMGDKIDWTLENGVIMGKRRTEHEIDFNEFPKEALIYLIQQSIEQDASVEDVFNDVLRDTVECFENFNKDFNKDFGKDATPTAMPRPPATLSPGDRVLHEPSQREGTLENGFDPYDPSMLKVWFDKHVEPEFAKMGDLVKI